MYAPTVGRRVFAYADALSKPRRPRRSRLAATRPRPADRASLTPSTDHSREHALLLAYVRGKNAAGRIHEGEFADVGATVNAWLGGKAPPKSLPGRPIVEQ